MGYTHTPANRHAQVIIWKWGFKITISSENVADGIAMGIKTIFRKTMTQADWDRIVSTLDGIFLTYEG